MSERMVWSGQCDECFSLYTLVASDETSQEAQDLTSENWPRQGDCLVDDCEGTIEWNGNDPLPVTIR